MLADAWLKMVGALTPDDIKLLKARGCASELFVLLEAFDKFVLECKLTYTGRLYKKVLDDVQSRLTELRATLPLGW